MATPPNTIASSRVQRVQAVAPKGPPPPENKYRVQAHGENVFIMHPLSGQAISVDDAKMLAAWISLTADISDAELIAARDLIRGEPEPHETDEPAQS